MDEREVRVGHAELLEVGPVTALSLSRRLCLVSLSRRPLPIQGEKGERTFSLYESSFDSRGGTFGKDTHACRWSLCVRDLRARVGVGAAHDLGLQEHLGARNLPPTQLSSRVSFSTRKVRFKSDDSNDRDFQRTRRRVYGRLSSRTRSIRYLESLVDSVYDTLSNTPHGRILGSILTRIPAN